MSGTVYCSVQKGEPCRTRAILPKSLIEHYKLDFKVGEPDEHFPSEFPANLVPSLRYSNGRILVESIPIALLLADKIPKTEGLLGDGSPEDRARILAWLNTLNLEVMNSIATLFTMVVGRQPYHEVRWETAKKVLHHELTALNTHLTKNTYLVGEHVTLADLYGVPMLLRALQHLWGPEERAKYPAVIRWFNTVSRAKVFNGFFDDLEFAKVSGKPKTA